MGKYSVLLSSSASRDLKRLDRAILMRITSAIGLLANESRPAGCRQIKSEPGLWRIRVGDWRIAYRIDDTAQTVTITRIAHRSEFYD